LQSALLASIHIQQFLFFLYKNYKRTFGNLQVHHNAATRIDEPEQEAAYQG
jgi:hypothetical protein